jgi:hypothetical protein
VNLDVMSVKEFKNAGVNWTPDDFSNCLAYNTFG